MTKDKKEKKEKKKKTPDSNDPQSSAKETIQQDELLIESKKDDTRLLELEFFSKEELEQKINELKDEISSIEKKLKDSTDDLKKKEKDAADWKNKYIHLQAEFENAQKRWEKNRQNLRVQYSASVIKSFLPLYDSFKKAMESNEREDSPLNGFFKQFMSILKSNKAEHIEIKDGDSFDYNYHEALTSLEREDLPKNTIIEVVQDGWKMEKEVIRYAKVIISKKPKPPEPPPEEKEEKEKDEDEDKEGSTEEPPEESEKVELKAESEEKSEVDSTESKENDPDYIS